MQKTNQELEQLVIHEYLHPNKGSSGVKAIGDKLGLNSVTVFNILKRNNITLRSKGGYEKNYFDKDEIVSDYLNGVRITEIAKKYNVAVETIYYFLKQLGVERNQIYINKNLRRDYFREIDSYDKAYFLGLMITDGCVLENNGVSLTLKTSDDYILETFNQKICNENSIYRYAKNNRFESTFHFKSREVQIDLVKYGVVFRKTPITFFPFLRRHPEMMRHMVRGLIDGDGWISYKSHSIGICSASYQFIYWFRKFIVDVLDVSSPSIIVNTHNRNVPLYSVQWRSKNDIYAIGRFIYIGKKDCYIHRKYNNWLKIIIHDNTEVT